MQCKVQCTVPVHWLGTLAVAGIAINIKRRHQTHYQIESHTRMPPAFDAILRLWSIIMQTQSYRVHSRILGRNFAINIARSASKSLHVLHSILYSSSAEERSGAKHTPVDCSPKLFAQPFRRTEPVVRICCVLHVKWCVITCTRSFAYPNSIHMQTAYSNRIANEVLLLCAWAAYVLRIIEFISLFSLCSCVETQNCSRITARYHINYPYGKSWPQVCKFNFIVHGIIVCCVDAVLFAVPVHSGVGVGFVGNAMLVLWWYAWVCVCMQKFCVTVGVATSSYAHLHFALCATRAQHAQPRVNFTRSRFIMSFSSTCSLLHENA